MGGSGGFSQSSNHYQRDLLPLGPEASWQSQVFRPLKKVRSTDFTSGSMMLQRASGMGKKGLLLDPVGCNSLTKGVHSMSSLPAWVGQAKPIGVRQFLR